ncbi:DNA polymerase kappa-like [Spinacia oleracea]|uniref:DNA polymerase kappa-like n=1 Tax=Spinacia oleracea TaxID=3562 RepID=A0ABM3R3M7_SPIOL|nr:DNA polymerase kappa-like [Spinacia oleracea]
MDVVEVPPPAELVAAQPSSSKQQRNKRNRNTFTSALVPAAPVSNHRRMWVVDRLKDWWEKCSHPDYPDEEFKKSFRMSKATFEMLCEEFRNLFIIWMSISLILNVGSLGLDKFLGLKESSRTSSTASRKLPKDLLFYLILICSPFSFVIKKRSAILLPSIVISASLNEAYLDITEVCRERDVRSDDVAGEIRRGVFEETGLTCSAGVAPNRLLAKVCSDINKPNGQFILPNDRLAVMTFNSSLPIRKIGGIGKVTEHILRNTFERNTRKDLLEKGSFLCALFSPSSAAVW